MSRRGPHEGSIYQRTSDGRWVGALDLGWTKDGRSRKSVYGKTRREVQLKLADLRRQHGLGVRIDLTEQTVSEYLARWLVYKKGQVRPRTYAVYAHYLENHTTAIAKTRLQQLRTHEVQRMLDALTLEPRSIKHVRDVLRNALNDAVRWGECERNAAAHAQPPPQVHTPVAAMTQTQAQALLTATQAHRLRALYVLTLCVGLRRSEALALMWTDVDLEGGVLQVRRGLHRAPGVGLVIEEPKSERSRRDVALPALAVAALEAHRAHQAVERLHAGREWQDLGYIFTTHRGRPLDPNFISREFSGIATSAGLKLTFHQLRHGAATLMLAEGVSLKIVQETLGHATIAITADIYGHVAPETQRQAAVAMNAALTATVTATPAPKGGRRRPRK